MEYEYKEKIIKIEQELEQIKKRNKRVEIDKGWETSFARSVASAVLTYGVVIVTMLIVNIPHPWVNALIPTLGFLLSVQSLPFLKKRWISRLLRKNA